MSNMTALVLIDIQNDYFEGGKLPLENPIAAANNARQLLDSFRQNGQLIIHIEHDNVDESRPFLFRGTQGQLIHESVAPLSDEIVIKKQFPSAFWQTNLQEVLEQHGVQNLVIAGMMTHMCVSTTTRAAMERGYMATVITDACATCDLEFQGEILPAQTVHRSALAEVQMLANLATTEQYLNV